MSKSAPHSNGYRDHARTVAHSLPARYERARAFRSLIRSLAARSGSLPTSPADTRPVISVVTAGEIRSLALQWKWGDKKIAQMEYALGFFKALTIHESDLIRAYAAIDACCEEIGQPLGKNDVWIAATAAVTGACLLTTDRDFDRLAPRFLTRDWIDPNTTAKS